jgi:segregation and condensation protein A
MMHIADIIENLDSIRFEELFKDSFTRVQLIVTFLALLELLRVGLARVYQEREFGNIWVINPQKQDSAAAEQPAS